MSLTVLSVSGQSSRAGSAGVVQGGVGPGHNSVTSGSGQAGPGRLCEDRLATLGPVLA